MSCRFTCLYDKLMPATCLKCKHEQKQKLVVLTRIAICFQLRRTNIITLPLAAYTQANITTTSLVNFRIKFHSFIHSISIHFACSRCYSIKSFRYFSFEFRRKISIISEKKKNIVFLICQLGLIGLKKSYAEFRSVFTLSFRCLCISHAPSSFLYQPMKLFL